MSLFEPSQIVLKVGSHQLRWPQLKAGFEAMRPGKGIDYFEAWNVACALKQVAERRGLNASYVADRLIQRARKGGYIKHRGRGQWIRTALQEDSEHG